jgi:hypothetical protein
MGTRGKLGRAPVARSRSLRRALEGLDSLNGTYLCHVAVSDERLLILISNRFELDGAI